MNFAVVHYEFRTRTRAVQYLITRPLILFVSTIMANTTATAAAPEVYTVIPPQPSEKKPGQLEQWQLEQFFDKGFVVVPAFFTKEELQPALEVREALSSNCFNILLFTECNEYSAQLCVLQSHRQ